MDSMCWTKLFCNLMATSPVSKYLILEPSIEAQRGIMDKEARRQHVFINDKSKKFNFLLFCFTHAEHQLMLELPLNTN